MGTKNGAEPWWGDTADAQGMKDALELVARGEYAKPLGRGEDDPGIGRGILDVMYNDLQNADINPFRVFTIVFGVVLIAAVVIKIISDLGIAF